MQLFPLFQDYDRVNMGSVSRRQVRDAIVLGAGKGFYSPGGQVTDAIV